MYKLRTATRIFLIVHYAVLQEASLPIFIAEHETTVQHRKARTPQGCGVGGEKNGDILLRVSAVSEVSCSKISRFAFMMGLKF